MSEVQEVDPSVGSAPPVKINNYHVVRNTPDFVTFSIVPRVVSKDVSKLAFFTEYEDTEVAIEDGCIMLSGKQKAEHSTTKAFLKLSKNHQHKIVDVDKPPRGGLFVTVLKVGATNETPPPLDDMITGRFKQRIIGPDGLDLPTSKASLLCPCQHESALRTCASVLRLA